MVHFYVPLTLSEQTGFASCERGVWGHLRPKIHDTNSNKWAERAPIKMQTKFLPVTLLRPQLLKCISKAKEQGQEYIITKKGSPAAVIIGFDEWESLQETRAILNDPQSIKRIKKSRLYFKRGGKGKTIEEVFEK